MKMNERKTIYKGDIILVDFKRNEGSEQNGVRPAVVLQNEVGNMFSPTTIVCPMTSKEKSIDVTHVELFPEECGILQPSFVLCEQIRVIDKSRILGKVGHLSSSGKLSAIERKVMFSIGISG